MSDDGALCSEWDLPDDAIAQAEIRVIQYVTAQGTVEYTVKHAGLCPLSTYLGLLDLVKFTLHAEWTADET